MPSRPPIASTMGMPLSSSSGTSHSGPTVTDSGSTSWIDTMMTTTRMTARIVVRRSDGNATTHPPLS